LNSDQLTEPISYASYILQPWLLEFIFLILLLITFIKHSENWKAKFLINLGSGIKDFSELVLKGKKEYVLHHFILKSL